MARLRDRYFEDVVPALMKEFGYSNIMQVPRIDKVVINMGMGEAIQNAKSLDAAVSDLSLITGQRPIVTRAKKSISTFKLREGMPIGVKVTLRGPRMYEFLDRLFNVALARIRDFGGLSPDAFDGRGNYTVGIKEHVAFPEIDFDKVDRVRGLEATIVTSAKSDQEARVLLELLGLPFRKSQ